MWVDPVRESKDDAQDNDVSHVVKEYGKFAYLEGTCFLLTIGRNNQSFH